MDVNDRIKKLINEHEKAKNITLTDEQKELVKYGYTVALLDSIQVPTSMKDKIEIVGGKGV